MSRGFPYFIILCSNAFTRTLSCAVPAFSRRLIRSRVSHRLL